MLWKRNNGISRAPSIAVAWVMHSQQKSLCEAFEYIKCRRPQVSPNHGFIDQLGQLELELFPHLSRPTLLSRAKRLSQCQRQTVVMQITLYKTTEDWSSHVSQAAIDWSESVEMKGFGCNVMEKSSTSARVTCTYSRDEQPIDDDLAESLVDHLVRLECITDCKVLSIHTHQA